MIVTSFTELFTIPFGWKQYGALWDLVCHTGIVFLPFVRIFMHNISQLLTGNDLEQNSSIILKKSIFDVISMLIIVSIALVPSMPLNLEKLQFAPRFNLDGKKINVNATKSGTTFDAAINQPKNVKVPILQYATMSVSYGVVAGLNSILEPVHGLRSIHAELNASSIKNSALRAEVIDFYNQCWKPCYAKYIKDKPELSSYPVDDPNWLGSHFFLREDGYYNRYYSHQPIANFTHSAIDDGFDEEWSRPTCKNWWSTKNYGLGPRLSKELPKSFITSMQEMFGEVKSDVYESGIRRLLDISLPTGLELLGDEHANGRHQVTKNITAPIGTFMQSFGVYPKLHNIISALPVIQAVLLVFIAIILPIIAVITNFKLQPIVAVNAAIAAIIFWSHLWELINILDDLLIRAFYPYSHLLIGGTQSQGEYIVDFVVLSMYIVFPLLTLGLVSWSGWSLGGVITGQIGQALSSFSGIGDKASAVTTGAARMIPGKFK